MKYRPSLSAVYSRFVFAFLLVFVGISANAQLLDTRISVNLESGSIEENLLRVKKVSGIHLAYESTGLRSFSIKGRAFHQETLSTVLHYLLDDIGYHFEVNHGLIVIGPVPEELNPTVSTFQLKGVIEDKRTGEKLKGVAVYNVMDRVGTFTDQYGYFSLSSVSDTVKLRIRYMSYKPAEILLPATDTQRLTIKMDVAPESLDSVLIVLPSDIAIFSPLTNISSSVREVTSLPKFCGDLGLLNMVRTGPGIQGSNDGSGSLIVRGGTPGQNLLLLDDATIYGASHLFGMASSLNTNAVRNINIYKGAFPARFGGRLSSVWDIALKTGHPETFHGSVSLGNLATDILLEGPIIKNKTSFLLAARRSYHDYYVRFFTPGLKTFYFQDLNFKLYHKFSKNDHLYLTAYTSKDKFGLVSDTINTRDSIFAYDQHQSIYLTNKNKAATLRWRHYFNSKFTLDLSLMYSRYQLSIGNQNEITTTYLPDNRHLTIKLDESINTGLSDITAKVITRYTWSPSHQLDAGFYYTRHSFLPHSFSFTLASSDSLLSALPLLRDTIRDFRLDEMGFFIDNTFDLFPKVKLAVGLRLNRPRSFGAAYFSFQPRLGVRYQFQPKWCLNIAYASMQQSLHQLSISRTSLPVNFWIPSTNALKPQLSNQLAIGISGNLFNGLFDLSMETYYKRMDNVIDYLIFRTPDSTSNKVLEDWEQWTTVGKGAAYGMEFSIRKSKGIFKGWLSYALAWSTRTFPEVNGGLIFPYKHDRRHSLNIVSLYKLGEHLELSGVFAFQSKPKAPVPIVKTNEEAYFEENIKAVVSSDELSAYHRLDLGINWRVQYSERLSGSWNLSVLNVYNSNNLFYYFPNHQGDRLLSTSLMPIAVSLSGTLSF